MKGLTRYTFEKTNFQGWRACISMYGHTFQRYYSDKKFDTPEDGKNAALADLEKVREILSDAKLTNKGKLSAATIKRCERILGSREKRRV